MAFAGFAKRPFPMPEIMMTDIPKLETEFLLRRAEEEAILAIRTDHSNAAAVHFDLSLRYGERAREALTSDTGDRAAATGPISQLPVAQ